MNRVALAILGVILAVTLIVVIARESSDGQPPPPPPKPAPVLPSGTPRNGGGEPDVIDPDELELEVKELSFGDGSANQRSIRIEGANVAMATKLRDWLEPRESAAVASRSAIDCHAQLARTNLVSVVCVTMPAGEADGGVARYESLTLRAVNGEIKELGIADILIPDAGQPDAITWPPTAFAVGPDGALFLCHDSHCVNIEGEPLVRPELLH